MSELPGTGVGRGVALGPVLRMPEPLGAPSSAPLDGPVEAADAAVHEAVAAVADDLTKRGALAGGDAQAVLEAQALMAQDPTLLDDVHTRISGGANAERAVHDAFAAFQDILAAMGGYMGERAADLGDVSQRIIAKLRGVPAPGVPDSDTPFVLVARDLAPADTALLDLGKVLALVTSDGGPTSHTAILARAKGITAIVGVEGAADLVDGQTVVVDAAAGVVVTDPDPDLVTATEARIAERLAAADRPVTPGALADGTLVPLLANLGNPADAAGAVALGAEGVGLFRTEFLFLDSPTAPTVEAQRQAYVQLLSAFPGKKVVVRALDAGADKPLSFLTDQDEENPALGRRGLRALRHHEAVLRDQLTALVQADAETEADLWVMAPMVADAEETAYFVSLARELGVRTAGVMAEVPSLALLAEQVFQQADFVSIGTNDLTQYTLAADRLLGSVASYQDPWHPAVLRLVAQLGAAGRDAGKAVGICGEAAADPLLAVVLVGLGATTLSMTPAALADVRAELGQHTLEQAREMARAALAAPSAAAARAAATSAHVA
ncbi:MULTISPECIES: phosphoenolpyruvate--protein phosphotransferase [unclassified Curtobacterium]|uniref:phosphoenolpyruvate--protein phosphotransferase n=1 Tax=unclassified Curtobacterium TaxID=257496 RepID=UPI000DA7B0CC|nr:MULTISPECIES: phosphoenolpyruvate--protein phosphotransferase [unclassified Curtobacterium]PZE26459.1 phosphoenolpyruvate--protein phosphotransferase [Curtobacterium sp. MCBD17_028]WIE53613.1 phosphoenolpyruvate--protein phosphotransferase [Curtobacterium sp. MCBD17_003]